MKANSSQLPALIDLLRKLDPEITAEEVAEMLWLATHLPPTATPSAGDTPKKPVSQPGDNQTVHPSADARPSLPPQRGEHFGATVTVGEGEAGQSAATANLYPTQAQTTAGGQRARSFRSPAAYALPGTLEIGRNLRPLKRRVPSRTRLIFDEAATAHRIADTGDWMPVLKAAAERWLAVTLLVDESSSMVIWQRMISELKALLEQQGAFRTVNLWGFRSQTDAMGVTLYSGIGPTANRDRPHRAAELNDPLGRRLVLVVSDCVAPIWHNGVMATQLAAWGRAGLVTLLQVLPDRLWVRSGLRTFPAIYLRSPASGAPNAEFQLEWTTHPLAQRPLHSVPVPVAPLDALPLGYWAQALAGNSNLWLPGVLAVPNPVDPETGAAIIPTLPARAAAGTSAEQLLRLFYGTASPTARRLANCLAAVPLTLPIMRLVQRALLPEARVAHLAEVFLSGLIERPTQVDDGKSADSVEYFFVEGVRDRLLNNLRLTETFDVLEIVSTYVGEHLEQPLDFGALIADPLATGDPKTGGLTIANEYQAFARIAIPALRRFGRQYADLAARLEASLGDKRTKPAPATAHDLGQPQSTRRTPRRGAVTIYAILVGINTYADKTMPALRSAVHDVRTAQSWLQERLHVDVPNLHLLIDSAATKSAILASWHSLTTRMEEGDQLYFHYSGLDLAVASDDPHEGDGLEETLFVYDSKVDDRQSLVAYRELATLADAVTARGGQVVAFLDTCRSGSGYLTRRRADNTLWIATSHEAEQSYEGLIDGNQAGVASHFLAAAMKNYRQGMGWAELFDFVYVNVKANYPQQTPQLIGPRDLAAFADEHKPIAPYLLVMAVDAEKSTVRINAHPALGLQLGALLAIYPPGSAITMPSDLTPLTQARVREIDETAVTATLETPSTTVLVGSRAQIVSYGEAQELRVEWETEAALELPNSPLVVNLARSADIDYRVVWSQAHYRIESATGVTILEATVAPNEPLEATTDTIRQRLEHLARFRHMLTRLNPAPPTDLADAITLTVAAADLAGDATVQTGKPVTLLLRNQGAVDLYISLWLLNTRLGVQRIYPADTDCLLLGKGREIRLPVLIAKLMRDDEPEKVLFKIFATRQPAMLDGLQLPDLDQSVDLAALLAYEQSRGKGSYPVSGDRP